jgi:CRISPR system Cascade subunit CasC
MIVELHMLQNFAPSCLNRDDTGSPKECEFGGHRRARISSQCIKRAMREHFRESRMLTSESLAKRTKLVADELTRRLVSQGKDAEQTQSAVSKALNGLKLSLVKERKTEYLVFIGETELANLANVILNYWTELQAKELSKDLEKRLLGVLDGGKAVDLALFGRMLADLPEKNIDAACQVAHAFSTHKVGVEFDFYTAIDDLQPKEEAGAGMMGTIEFNSACYYRYANIDTGQLKGNLGGDEVLARKAVEAFIRAAVTAVPTGKQASMASPNPPSFVFAVVRDSGTWSLANAFVKPIYPDKDSDLVRLSTAVMVDYWNKLTKVYGNASIKTRVALSLDDASFTGLDKAESLDKLVCAVDKAITF